MVICLFNLSLYRLHSPTKKQTNECLYVYSSPFEYWSGIDKCAWRIIEFIWVVFFLSYWFYFVSWTEHKAIYWIDYVLSFKWKCTLNGKILYESCWACWRWQVHTYIDSIRLVRFWIHRMLWQSPVCVCFHSIGASGDFICYSTENAFAQIMKMLYPIE